MHWPVTTGIIVIISHHHFVSTMLGAAPILTEVAWSKGRYDSYVLCPDGSLGFYNQFFGGRVGGNDHQGQEELYLWSEVMKFRQHHPPFSPSAVHSIANYLSFHSSNHPTIHPSISTTNFYMDSSTSCPIVLFLRPGYPGTCFPMYRTMWLKFLGRHFSVD